MSKTWELVCDLEWSTLVYTDSPPGSPVPQHEAQHGGGEDDQPGHQAASPQPEMVQLGAEEGESSVMANIGQEEGGQHQNLQTSREKHKLSWD